MITAAPATLKPMPTLTVSQPYASLIAGGSKWIANRSWETLYRGPLAIHAGKGTQYLTRWELERYDVGCFVCVVELVCCIHLNAAYGAFKATGTVRTLAAAGIDPRTVFENEHADGPFCWILRNPRRVEKVKRAGRQGLWMAPRLQIAEVGR
jgi:hypothetical protein